MSSFVIDRLRMSLPVIVAAAYADPPSAVNRAR
jgi:hypothetical protein